jgi:hypothetical protein
MILIGRASFSNSFPLQAMGHSAFFPVPGGVAEWSNALVLKTSVGQLTVGSNPTPSATLIISRLRSEQGSVTTVVTTCVSKFVDVRRSARGPFHLFLPDALPQRPCQPLHLAHPAADVVEAPVVPDDCQLPAMIPTQERDRRARGARGVEALWFPDSVSGEQAHCSPLPKKKRIIPSFDTSTDPRHRAGQGRCNSSRRAT